MGTIQQTLASLGGAGLLFDGFSMTNAGLWDLQKVRSDYTGYAVRAAPTTTI